MVGEPNVQRDEKRQVKLSDAHGEAIFLNGVLWTLNLKGNISGNYAALPLPADPAHTVERLTDYIEFIRFVRAEVRRLRDGAQEVEDGE